VVGQIPHEASDQASSFGCHPVKRVESSLVDQLSIESDVELCIYFTSRTFGDGKKASKLNTSASFETFRDIGHYGNSGTTYLIAKSEVTRERAVVRHGIDGACQFPGLLPSLYILESFDLCHDPQPATRNPQPSY